jgi:hypothetical protein
MATGQDPTIDPNEVELLWRSLSDAPNVWEWQRENGWYAAPIAVPANGGPGTTHCGDRRRQPHLVAGWFTDSVYARSARAVGLRRDEA